MELSLNDLLAACSAGGSSVLTSVTYLQAAAGPHSSIAPAKYVERSESVFAFEDRYVDGESKRVVLIDSKQSQLNRAEDAIMQDLRAGNQVLSLIPRLEVSYEGGKTFSDMELPHRFADAHFRSGEIDGTPTTQNEQYLAARNSTPADMRNLLNLAPAGLAFGVWDSTRKWNQIRVRSALVGEIIGVVANQDSADSFSRRGGARVDPVAASVKLSGPQILELAEAQKAELSAKNFEKISEQAKKLKKDATLSASGLGLGAIPPSLDALGGVSCSQIIRSWVLSFAALRQLRFGGPEKNDVAGRALLAALSLSAMARAERELYLRANCDLVEVSKPEVFLDLRYGEKRELSPIEVEAADALLTEAIAYAKQCGVADWHGQVLQVVGNPIILQAGSEDVEE